MERRLYRFPTLYFKGRTSSNSAYCLMQNSMKMHIKFKKFSRGNAPHPKLGMGYGVFPQTSPLRRSGASILDRGLWPLHRPWGGLRPRSVKTKLMLTARPLYTVYFYFTSNLVCRLVIIKRKCVCLNRTSQIIRPIGYISAVVYTMAICPVVGTFCPQNYC